MGELSERFYFILLIVRGREGGRMGGGKGGREEGRDNYFSQLAPKKPHPLFEKSL